MSRHASTEVLARYTGGDLKPRKAVRVASHLAGCATCRERVHALESVPSMLASVQFPPIPANLSSRIEMAIAGESAARVAREPASEAGRRDLPAGAAQPVTVHACPAGRRRSYPVRWQPPPLPWLLQRAATRWPHTSAGPHPGRRQGARRWPGPPRRD